MKMKKYEAEPDRERAKRYIASVKWKIAKTMPPNLHGYALKKWKAESAGDFAWLVVGIRKYGYQRALYGRRYTYFRVEGLVSWTMGASMADTILINRAVVNGIPDRTRR